MKYLETKIYTTTEALEILTFILSETGIDAFVTEDKNDYLELFGKKNTYDWDYLDAEVIARGDIETNITIYLEETSENHKRIGELTEKIGELRAGDKTGTYGRLHIETIVSCDDEWKDNWKEYFKPTKVTDRIIVKPTWETYEKHDPDELIIEIDPGMAFGTGTHPTTSMCMRLIEKYLSSPDDKILDIGCGSGILSIAAALLGAREVVGIEIDPIAVEVAKENVILNKLEDRITVREGDITKGTDIKSDIIVANLMADLVIMLSKFIPAHLFEGGKYISSGILIEKQEEVRKAIEAAGFNILEIMEEGEWCAIAAEMPGREDE